MKPYLHKKLQHPIFPTARPGFSRSQAKLGLRPREARLCCREDAAPHHFTESTAAAVANRFSRGPITEVVKPINHHTATAGPGQYFKRIPESESSSHTAYLLIVNGWSRGGERGVRGGLDRTLQREQWPNQAGRKPARIRACRPHVTVCPQDDPWSRVCHELCIPARLIR